MSLFINLGCTCHSDFTIFVWTNKIQISSKILEEAWTILFEMVLRNHKWYTYNLSASQMHWTKQTHDPIAYEMRSTKHASWFDYFKWLWTVKSLGVISPKVIQNEISKQAWTCHWLCVYESLKLLLFKEINK